MHSKLLHGGLGAIILNRIWELDQCILNIIWELCQYILNMLWELGPYILNIMWQSVLLVDLSLPLRPLESAAHKTGLKFGLGPSGSQMARFRSV